MASDCRIGIHVNDVRAGNNHGSPGDGTKSIEKGIGAVNRRRSPREAQRAWRWQASDADIPEVPKQHNVYAKTKGDVWSKGKVTYITREMVGCLPAIAGTLCRSGRITVAGGIIMHIYRFTFRLVLPLLCLLGAGMPGVSADTIFTAVNAGNLGAVGKLLAADPQLVHARDADFESTPLHWAAFHGHETIVTFLLGYKADPNARNNVGRTPLHFAAARGHLTSISELLMGGANVNAQDNDGNTPLHLAAALGKLEAVTALIKGGADITLLNGNGQTAAAFAEQNGHPDAAALIRKAAIPAAPPAVPDASAGMFLVKDRFWVARAYEVHWLDGGTKIIYTIRGNDGMIPEGLFITDDQLRNPRKLCNRPLGFIGVSDDGKSVLVNLNPAQYFQVGPRNATYGWVTIDEETVTPATFDEVIKFRERRRQQAGKSTVSPSTKYRYATKDYFIGEARVYDLLLTDQQNKEYAIIQRLRRMQFLWLPNDYLIVQGTQVPNTDFCVAVNPAQPDKLIPLTLPPNCSGLYQSPAAVHGFEYFSYNIEQQNQAVALWLTPIGRPPLKLLDGMKVRDGEPINYVMNWEWSADKTRLALSYDSRVQKNLCVSVLHFQQPGAGGN